MIQINLKRGGRGRSSLSPLQVFAGGTREQILQLLNKREFDEVKRAVMKDNSAIPMRLRIGIAPCRLNGLVCRGEERTVFSLPLLVVRERRSRK